MKEIENQDQGKAEKFRLFTDMDNALLKEGKPSAGIAPLLQNPLLDEWPFICIKRMKYTKQNERHHPEGDVFIHTMMVLDLAGSLKHKSNNPRAFMWGALLHDVGKPKTTEVKNNRIVAYSHDKAGAPIAGRFLQYFGSEPEFVDLVCAFVRWHMLPGFIGRQTQEEQKKNIRQMKAAIHPEEVILLSYCDRLGRGNSDPKDALSRIAEFREIMEKYQ